MNKQTLDIVQLIDKNPITKLSQKYQSKLLQKLQENFTNTQQHIFVSSFFCYLNYTNNDFVIDLESVWKWLGFSRKEHCKVVLDKHFIKDIDYKIGFTEIAGKLKDGVNIGGRPKEKILLTINTFKKLCLKSNTKKADEIHDYFIKLEYILQETITEESDELKLQLTENKQLLLENQIQNVKEKHETLIFSYHKKRIVYIFKVIVNGKVYYKFGFTDNIKKRTNEHRRLMKCDVFLIFCIESINNIELENKLKKYFRDYKKKDYKRITLDINNYEYTEIIETINSQVINDIFLLLVDLNKNIGENVEKDILNTKKDILHLENENINLKIQYNEVQQQNFYIQELQDKLDNANNKIQELTNELNKFKHILNDDNLNTNQHFSNEIYEKFINDNCDLAPNYKSSGKDLLEAFKYSLQNTIYEAKINSFYNECKYSQQNNYYLPSFKKEFFDYFEKKLNYKASGIQFRNNEIIKIQRGFFGIILKSQNIKQQLYENNIYKDFISTHFCKDSFNYTIKKTDIVDLFIKYLDKNNIKILFKRAGSNPEFSQFLKEFFEFFNNYLNVTEQRINFKDFKSPRPGFRFIKQLNI